jgi:zinc protease
MRTATFLAASVLFAAADLPAQSLRLDSLVHAKTLDNGLQVVAINNSTVPFVTVELVVRAGAFIQETEADAGLPHLIEHLLLRGDALERAATDLDAIWNGETSEEAARFYFTFPSKHLSAGLDLLSRLVRKPDFSQKALDEERKVVQGEIERRASEPDLLLLVSSDMLLWDMTGWHFKNPGGNLFALNQATPKKLETIHKRFYVPNNAALIVSGDVSDSVVFSLATKSFSGWKPGGNPMEGLRPPAIAPLADIKRKIISAEVKDVEFLVRWHGPSARKDAQATYAADLFSALVNQRASKPQKHLVDTGLFDAVSMSYRTLDFVGPIELRARTTPERAAEAATALGDEIQQMTAPDYFDGTDIDLAKKLFRVSEHFGIESSFDAAHSAASFWSSAGLDYFMQYGEKVQTQTRSDINRFVAAYLGGKPLAAVVMVPEIAWGQAGLPLQRALGAWRLK